MWDNYLCVALVLSKMLIWYELELHHGEKQLNFFIQMDFRSSFLFSCESDFCEAIYFLLTNALVLCFPQFFMPHIFYLSPPSLHGGPSLSMCFSFSCGY